MEVQGFNKIPLGDGSYAISLLGSIIMDEISKSKEYHFRNMHVYVNAIFRDNPILRIQYHQRHLDPHHTMRKDHHVHIFMWNVNVNDENLADMMKFIGIANEITDRPVYIHTPRRSVRTTAILAAMLKMNRYKGQPLLYRLIVEKNSTVTKFNYGDYIPIDNNTYGHARRPNSWLKISWDDHEYAKPEFFKSEDNK